MTDRQRELKKRIVELTFKKKLSHLGSSLSSVDLIDCVYAIKDKKDIFVLSNGHAGMALYVVLEKYKILKSKDIESLSIHPDRNLDLGVYVSTGSLGQGLPIAVGMALADRKKKVYCLISDGECAEGSIWEALRVLVEQKLRNLTVIVNANGWGAYGRINLYALKEKLQAFGFDILSVNGHNFIEIEKALVEESGDIKLIFATTVVEHFPFLTGLDAHYYTMKEEDYRSALEMLKT